MFVLLIPFPFLPILGALTVSLKGDVCTALKKGGFKNRSTGGREIRRQGKRDRGGGGGGGLERRGEEEVCQGQR